MGKINGICSKGFASLVLDTVHLKRWKHLAGEEFQKEKEVQKVIPQKQIDLLKKTDQGAIISEDEQYRYALWRTWDKEKPTLAFVGLNPSTADAENDDATIKKIIKFCKRWGFGRLVMINLFAFRATEPDDMMKAEKPAGDMNDLWLITIADLADEVVLGWGNDGKYLKQNEWVVNLLEARCKKPLKCLFKNKGGSPKHPLYIKDETDLIEYNHD